MINIKFLYFFILYKQIINQRMNGIRQKPSKLKKGMFDVMYKKKGHTHWFVGEGMNEGEFIEARNNLVDLINDYSSLEKNNETEEAEDEEETNTGK